jgi:hypothetical protein
MLWYHMYIDPMMVVHSMRMKMICKAWNLMLGSFASSFAAVFIFKFISAVLGKMLGEVRYGDVRSNRTIVRETPKTAQSSGRRSSSSLLLLCVAVMVVELHFQDLAPTRLQAA